MDATTLLAQLAELGRQLDKEVDLMGEFDVLATGLGCEYQKLREEHEDRCAETFLALADGGVEAKENGGETEMHSVETHRAGREFAVGAG